LSTHPKVLVATLEKSPRLNFKKESFLIPPRGKKGELGKHREKNSQNPQKKGFGP